VLIDDDDDDDDDDVAKFILNNVHKGSTVFSPQDGLMMNVSTIILTMFLHHYPRV